MKEDARKLKEAQDKMPTRFEAMKSMDFDEFRKELCSLFDFDEYECCEFCPFGHKCDRQNNPIANWLNEPMQVNVFDLMRDYINEHKEDKR